MEKTQRESKRSRMHVDSLTIEPETIHSLYFVLSQMISKIRTTTELKKRLELCIGMASPYGEIQDVKPPFVKKEDNIPIS